MTCKMFSDSTKTALLANILYYRTFAIKETRMRITNQNMPRWLIFLIDMGIITFSVFLAYMLRFNFHVPDHEIKEWPKVLLWYWVYVVSVFSSPKPMQESSGLPPLKMPSGFFGKSQWKHNFYDSQPYFILFY